MSLSFLSSQLIREVCQTVGHVWRERVLDAVTTVHLFVLQILHGNTACPQVPRLGAVACSGEAHCDHVTFDWMGGRHFVSPRADHRQAAGRGWDVAEGHFPMGHSSWGSRVFTLVKHPHNLHRKPVWYSQDMQVRWRFS